jgi:hypothetical protein
VFGGLLRIRFVVDVSGAVSLVMAFDSELIRPALTACVAQVFQSSRYPGEVNSELVAVTLHVTFRAPQPPPPAR